MAICRCCLSLLPDSQFLYCTPVYAILLVWYPVAWGSVTFWWRSGMWIAGTWSHSPDMSGPTQNSEIHEQILQWVCLLTGFFACLFCAGDKGRSLWGDMILTWVSTSQAHEGSIHYRMKRYTPLQIHKSTRTEQLQLAVLPVSGHGYPNKLISGCAPMKFPKG